MLWMFSIPMLLSVAFQQVYQIADSIIAGQFIGEAALAAVGASHPITMIFMAVAVGSNIGCAVVVSRLFGAKKYSALKTAIHHPPRLSCGQRGSDACRHFRRKCHASASSRTLADVFADASLYLKIYIYGFLFLYLYNICNGIFTSLGDSRTPLYFLIGSSISNILLDIIFVVSG
ncbi:MAG: MATE family efflux transporter [Anaerotignum faecicola]